jgi:hypothetical protein
MKPDHPEIDNMKAGEQFLRQAGEVLPDGDKTAKQKPRKKRRNFVVELSAMESRVKMALVLLRRSGQGSGQELVSVAIDVLEGKE